MKMKIAFTGASGTGKTTATYKEALNCKIVYPNNPVVIVSEVARDCPFPFNLNTTREAQIWIFINQMTREIQATSSTNIVVCDRTIMDAVAYTMHAGFMMLALEMWKVAADWCKTYDKIIFKSTRYNNYNYSDGIREVTNSDFRTEVERLLRKLYGSSGIDILEEEGEVLS
jgi:predicted ATPase